MFVFIKKIIKRILRLFVPAVQELPPVIIREYNTYSQAGEDAILNFLFNDKMIKNFKYLDIGTNLPDKVNNTYLFYLRGLRGVCVEADASLIDNIKKVRQEDTVINAGIAVSDLREADFFKFNISGINTFDKLEAEKRQASGLYQIISINKVPLLTIDEVIKQNFQTYPELLSIDIEGLDLEVLKSLNFDQFPIPVICVETCTYSETHVRPKDKSIEKFMIGKGYIVYADTYINTIFVNAQWFYTMEEKLLNKL